MPPLKPLPPGRYVFVVGTLVSNFGGRTASILNKCRLLKQIGGVDSTIVTLNYSSEVDDVPADLRRRGLLVDGVDVVNLLDYFETGAGPAPEVVRHSIEEPGMAVLHDPNLGVHRYFRDGVHVLSKRFDDQGRLRSRDWFNQNRARTRRDEFGASGLVRRTIYFDLYDERPRQEVYYRSDGTPCMNKWLAVDPATQTIRIERVTLLDEHGRPVQVLASNAALKQHVLDALLGDEHVFLTVESRRSDPETLSYRRPNVKQIYVLHNPHQTSSGQDTRIRPAYQPLFDQQEDVDAVVFLTNAQRADAEDRYGVRENFRVIPHAIRTSGKVASVGRDPNLVVMLVRLDQQKQLADAISAFAAVLKELPAARLEIYGDGPERAKLQRQIDRLGLGGSVTLMGYTTTPDAVYARAALSMLTSRFEGFGLVLLESLSAGCPVISYDVPYGPSDVVTNGVNGYLVPPGSTAELAARVVQVLRDEQLRRRLSEGAAAAIATFSEEAFVARWSALFNDLDARGWG